MMRRARRAAWVAALGLAIAGCAPEREGGGGGMGPAMLPATVTMVPRMISGHGRVTYRAEGEEVVIRIQAEALPAPYAYQIRLIGPGRRHGTHAESQVLAPAEVEGGSVDQAVRVSQVEFMRFRGVELVHLPTGTALDERQAHPALVASFPARVR